jgi:disulfide bond formation protein DsbB
VAVVSCPKCSTGLKVPDGSVAAVRCPKCKTTFSPPKPAAAGGGFEVVDESPRPAPRPAAPPAPPPATGPKTSFSMNDAVRSAESRRGRDDRDEDDDRPRRRRDDYDDEDDRPRGRSRRDRDDDYDDDRPRRRRDDDDDYDDRDRDRDRPRKKSPYGLARPAVLLILISLGVYLGTIALNAFFLFLAWVGAPIPNVMTTLLGVAGLLGWVVALVGLGLAIAGPPKARGLAIATAALAFVHLALAFTVAIERRSGAFGNNSVAALSAMNRFERFQDLQKELDKEMRTNPNSARAKALREDLSDAGRGGRVLGDEDTSVRWTDLITDLPRLDSLIAVLVYSAKGFEYYILSLLAGMAELARLILLGLLLAALARSAKDYRAENAAKFGWIAAPSAVGIAMLVVLLAMVLAKSAAESAVKGLAPPQMGPGMTFEQMQAEQERFNAKLRSLQRAPLHYATAAELLVYTLHGATLVLPGLAALGVFRSMGRRR